jgi:hypothetical protein
VSRRHHGKKGGKQEGPAGTGPQQQLQAVAGRLEALLFGGVGGAAAIEIGRRLARLAQRSQVIVVTHLAQVAAFANNHLTVQKDTSGEFTESSVHRLQGEERAAEMARLLSGLSDSDIELKSKQVAQRYIDSNFTLPAELVSQSIQLGTLAIALLGNKDTQSLKPPLIVAPE